jgi:pimeloyl-ACP methyl ester carboxylesterase
MMSPSAEVFWNRHAAFFSLRARSTKENSKIGRHPLSPHDLRTAILGGVNPIIKQPALMIYGEQDVIPKSGNLTNSVPNVDVVSLDCGHWIQQEMPEETTRTILEWLEESDGI